MPTTTFACRGRPWQTLEGAPIRQVTPCAAFSCYRLALSLLMPGLDLLFWIALTSLPPLPEVAFSWGTDPAAAQSYNSMLDMCALKNAISVGKRCSLLAALSALVALAVVSMWSFQVGWGAWQPGLLLVVSVSGASCEGLQPERSVLRYL